MGDWNTWTIEELERQMSPSRWNPNKTPDDVIKQHINTCTAETQKARQNVSYESNLSYGTSSSQKYDLYGNDLSENAPIFFWIHGGYWQEGSKDISAVMVENLYVIGVKTIVLGYSLAPQATLQQIRNEVYAALRQVILQFDKARLFVGGHSAGAQLAANILHDENEELGRLNFNNRLLGLILFSGVYDLRPIVPTYINDALKLSSNEAESLSPLLKNFNTWTLPKTFQVIVCVGKFDPPEFIRQSTDYASKLQPRFQNVNLWLSETDDHFTIVENLSVSTELSSGEYIQSMIKSII